MIDIGRVFSTSFAMLRERFWPLVGMWALFFVIQMAGVVLLSIGLAVVGIAGGAAGLGAGLDDLSALAGLGIGMIIFIVLYYAAYIVILLAQQAAMVALASPLEDPSFGGALSRGFMSALPFLAITLLLMLAYLAIALAVGAVLGAVGLGSETASGFLGILIALLFVPVAIYFGCRFSVLVPVVAVDQVFSPIAALRRSWALTRGKVLQIFLALLCFILISAVALGLPFGLIFGAVFAGGDDPAALGGLAIIGFLLMFPLFIIYTIYASAFTASLHSEVTDGGAEALEEVFA